jgi:hypothetical protein
MDEQAPPNVRVIAGAVAVLISLVGLFTISGAIGRVQRNEPVWFSLSLGLVAIAAACFVVAEILAPAPVADEPKEDEEGGEPRAAGSTQPSRSRARARTTLRIVATVLTLLGVLAVVIVTVSSTTARERPVVTGSLATTDGNPFTASVKVGSLSSHDRVAMIVDGLVADGRSFRPHTVYQAYIGPDQEGQIDHTVTMVVPNLDDYEALGVKAYTGPISNAPSDSDDTPCEEYPRQVSTQKDTVRQQGPGCVIIEIPEPVATPTPTPAQDSETP